MIGVVVNVLDYECLCYRLGGFVLILNVFECVVEIVGFMLFFCNVVYVFWGVDCIFDFDGDVFGLDDVNWCLLMVFFWYWDEKFGFW